MEDQRAKLKQMLDSGEIRLEPLTFPQRELWEAAPRPVGDVSNHICAFIQVRGPIKPGDCETAIQRVVDRQDVLRLSFLPAKGQAVQMIRNSGKANCTHRELAPPETEPAALEGIMREIFTRPFDLLAGPLYRVELLRIAPREHLIVFAIHHSIADGWTLGVFVQDLVAAYFQTIKGSKKPLPPVPQTCAAWGAAERAFWTPAEIEPRAAFWKTYLAGAPRLWAPKLPEQPLSGQLERWITEIPADQAAAVRKLAKRTGATLFSTLLTAFHSALAEWKGQADFVVGTPIANRNKLTARETMGYFAGNVPLRLKVDPTLPAEDRIKAIQDDTVEAFANAMPFTEIAKALGETPASVRNPLFDVRFALQNHPIPDVSVPGLSVKLRMRSTGTARFDLGCEITEDDKALELVWLYQPAIFSRQDSEDLDRIYRAHLAQLTATPARSPALFGKG